MRNGFCNVGFHDARKRELDNAAYFAGVSPGFIPRDPFYFTCGPASACRRLSAEERTAVELQMRAEGKL